MTLAYFPMFPADFDADTGHLSLAEDGAYNRLLRLSWRCPEAKMPDDLDWICRKSRAVTEDDRALIEAILAEFFTRKAGKVFSARLHKEWMQAHDAHSRRVLAGKSGGHAKALKRNTSASSNAMAMQEQCSSNQNQNQNHKEKEREAIASPKKSDASLVREALAEVIGDVLAADFIAHRIKLRKPMTPRAAKMIADKLRKADDPAACAEFSILKGWQDVFPEKFQVNSQQRSGFQPAQSDWLPKEIFR